jgi:2-amino-4-hydroxy-6-hydroxymethyldihydropteridine diphosphokinase
MTLTWTPVYVGLGSNLDDPCRQIERACAKLEALAESRFVVRSSLYRTPPFGPVAQPDFVNAAAGMLTRRTAPDFLVALKQIEGELGRAAPRVRWGPRRIDLDLLVFGRAQLDEPALRVPHPGIAERAFVLVPLAEIAPDLLVPGQGSVATLRDRIDASAVVRLAP